MSRPARRLAGFVAVGTAVAIFTGTLVTGAGPHAGDENAARLDLDIGSVARLHGSTVMLTIATVLLLAWRARTNRADRALTPAVSTWLFAGVLQAAIGYVQYFNDIPALLVGVHVAGATLVTWATTQLVLDTAESKSHCGISPAVVDELVSRT